MKENQFTLLRLSIIIKKCRGFTMADGCEL